MPPVQQVVPHVVFSSELHHVVLATQTLRNTAPVRVLPLVTVKVWIGGECYQAQLV